MIHYCTSLFGVSHCSLPKVKWHRLLQVILHYTNIAVVIINWHSIAQFLENEHSLEAAALIAAKMEARNSIS